MILGIVSYLQLLDQSYPFLLWEFMICSKTTYVQEKRDVSATEALKPTNVASHSGNHEDSFWDFSQKRSRNWVLICSMSTF